MGLAVVLLFWGLALSTLALITSASLAGATSLFVKPGMPHRKRIVAIVAAFPFGCVAFAGIWFAGYATINYSVFHRDPMLGDGWQTPLPNGYALMMIDTTDQGTVYDPQTQPGGGLVISGDDAVFGVRKLQVANNLIFGARDSRYSDRIGQDSQQVDRFFSLDTKKKTHFEFSSQEELRQSALREGVALNLQSFWSVYHHYRWTWFDGIAGLVLLVVPVFSFVALAWWILRMQGYLSSA